MKLSDIQREVNKDLDDSLPNSDLTGWVNRALDDLSAIAKYQKVATLQQVEDDTNYTLPADLIKIVHVFGSEELFPIPIQDNSTKGYKIWGNHLTIQPATDDEVKLFYYARLPHLRSPEDEPAIRSDFHDLLILYTVAKARYQDEEELYQSIVWNEYLMRKAEFTKAVAENNYETSQVRCVY